MNLNELHPYVKHLTEKLIDECKKQNINIAIVQGYRTIEYQNELYAQGRTKPGNIVTKAKGGQSIHNYRLAIDFAPIINGKIDWNNINIFKKVGKIGLSIGFDVYGGDWTSFKDYPHLQWTGGLTLKDLQSGKIPKNPLDGDDNVEHNKMEIRLSDDTKLNIDNYLVNGSTYVNLKDILKALGREIKIVQGNKIYIKK